MSEEFVLKFKGEISGREEINRFFDEANRNAERYEANLKRTLTSAGSYISAFAGKAKSELNSFAGKELNIGLGNQARGVLQLRDAINQLAVSAGGGNEMVAGLKDQIQSTASAANQLQGNVTEALAAFVEKTGKIDVARQNLMLYARAATATSAAVKDLALVGVELSDKLNVTDQAASFAILATQAKAGSIELKDLATKGPRLFAAAASAGATGERGVREAGALAQVYAKGFGGTGSAASVTTAVENTFTDILKKRGRLEQAGIRFTEKNAAGEVVQRDQFDVLKDIIRATGGDKQKLLEVFNARSIRGVDVLAREYRKTGGFATYENYRDIVADPGQIDRDFATRNSTGEAKLRANEVSRARFFDKYFGGVAEYGAAHATELQLGGMVLGGIGGGLGRAAGLLGRFGGAAGRLGGAVSAATAQRVFVVNWPGGVGGLGGGGLPGGAGVGLLGAAGQLAGAGVVGVAIGAAVGNYLDKHSTLARSFYEGEANLLGKVTGQKEKLSGIEAAGVELNQLQLERKKRHREALVQDFEMQGLTHGAALNAADQQIKAEVQNLTVVINGEEAHAETDTGTRSPKVMVKRGGRGAN
jgi:hypothetical protein